MCKNNAAFAVMGGAALWGFISVFVRGLTALGLSSLQIVACRSAMGALILGLWLLVKDPAALRIRLCHAWCFAGTGLLSLAFFNYCYFTAIRESQAGVAVVLLYTSPIFVMLLSAVIFREPITPQGLGALALTFFGCALVAGPAGGGVSPKVLLLGLGSGLGYALYSIFGRFALRHYSLFTVTFYTLVFSLFAVVPLAGPVSLVRTIARQPAALAWSAGIAFFCTVLPYLLYTWGLERMETGKAAVLATVEPAVGALLGIFVYKESAGMLRLAGMAMILAAVLLLEYRPKKRKCP